MFDFTSLFQAENASRVVERMGHKLLMCLVGDSLLEVGVVRKKSRIVKCVKSLKERCCNFTKFEFENIEIMEAYW